MCRTFARNMTHKTSFNLLLGTLLILGVLVVLPLGPQSPRSESHSHESEMVIAGTWIKPWRQMQSIPFQRIQRTRIFPVEKPYRIDAIELLKHQRVVLLSLDQQRHLMGGNELLGDAVVDRAVADAEAESRLPGAPKPSESIGYAQTLYGKLKPYLVRGVAANSNSVFSISWCGTDLCVGNGALGKVNYERKPLIVYLEKEPTALWVNAVSAE